MKPFTNSQYRLINSNINNFKYKKKYNKSKNIKSNSLVKNPKLTDYTINSIILDKLKT